MKKGRTCNHCKHSAANHQPKKKGKKTGCRVKGCTCTWPGPELPVKKKKKGGD